MKLFTDNIADSAIITDASASINYPPSNVKDSRLSRIYKSGKSASLDINAGGGLKSISEAYTNLVQDPTDLTTGNWAGNATATDSGEIIQGYKLWRLTPDTTGAYRAAESLSFNATSTLNVSRGICRKDSSDLTRFTLRNNTQALSSAELLITFSTKNITVSFGTLLKYQWIDDETLSVVVLADPSRITIGNSLELRLYANGAISNDLTTLWAQPQITEGSDTMYPFISGSKTADTITESFTMPDRFTFDMVVTPFFQYDTSDNDKCFFNWFTDVDNRFRVYYQESNDTIQIFWKNGTTGRGLVSQIFDDGSTRTLNQRIRIVGSMDLTSGSQTGSRFMAIPLEQGTFTEDSDWGGSPDVKTENYITLNIGFDGANDWIDSEFEYLRIYEGLLVGSVTSSDDVDTLLANKTLLFDKTYQSKITATDLLLANTTIRDGDTVILQANDVDSWGTGTPLYETVVWRKGIITHNFTKSTYQYYRLSVNSSNDLQIGRLYLGGGYSTPGMSPTVTDNRISASVKSITPSGQSYMDKRYIASVVNTTWPAVTHAEKAEIFAIFYAIDVGTPFFITFDESCSDLGTLYVTMDLDELSASLLQNPAYYTIGLTVREEV